MLETAVDDARHPQIVPLPRGPQTADAADQKFDLHPRLRGPVQTADDAAVRKTVHLGPDAPRAPRLDVFDLAVDESAELFPQIEGRDPDPFPAAPRSGIGGDGVEKFLHIETQRGVGAEKSDVGVNGGRPVVVVAGRKMHVPFQGAPLLAADDEQGLGVDLQPGDAADHPRPGLLEGLCPDKIVALVETGLELHEHGHLFPVLSRPGEGRYDRRIAADAVKRLFDREHVGIRGCGRHKFRDRVKCLVRMMHKDVALPDLLEHVAPRRELRYGLRLRVTVLAQIVKSVYAVRLHEISQIQRSVELENEVFCQGELF